MSILEELYNGNICPGNREVKKGSDFHKISLSIIETEEKLFKTLGQDEQELCERKVRARGYSRKGNFY